MLSRYFLLTVAALFAQSASAIEVLTSIKPIQMITYELMLGTRLDVLYLLEHRRTIMRYALQM